MSYADEKNIPFVIIMGSDEIQNNILSLKDMKTGFQEKINIESLIQKLS